MEDLILRITIFHGTVDTGTVLMIGAAIIIMSAVIFGALLKENAERSLLVGSGCGVVFGTIIFVLAKSGMADKAIIAFIFGCGVLAITVSAYMLYIPKCCNHQIRAVYMSSTVKTKDGVHMFAPVFDYTYDGKRYIRRASELYSCKEMRQLADGDSIDIYIDPKNPKICILKRRYRLLYVLIALIGIAIVVLAILALTTDTVQIALK